MEKTKLKELREAKGLSQAQLGKELELSQRAISHYEAGAREPDIKTIKKLCKFFDVTAGYLLGIEEF